MIKSNVVHIKSDGERTKLMEKKKETGNYVLEENMELGTVKIADEVVAMIAGLATTEVKGVAAMAGNVGNELLDKVGVRNLNKGVKVLVTGKKVRTDVAIYVQYGNNIPAVSQKVQEKVKTAIENMTGLEVTDVNVRIAGIAN